MSDKQKTILLVEDEKVIAMTEARLLQREGYDIIIAQDGNEAIGLVHAYNKVIDLILMDIDLGEGMDGTASAAEILLTHDIPVLFLSSHIEPEVVEKTEGLTSYGYIVKNSGNVVLLTSIKMAFRLHEANQLVRENNAELAAAYEEISAANEELIASETALYERDKALLESEERYHSLYSSMNEGVALHEMLFDGESRPIDYIINDVNPAFERILGISREKAIGVKASVLYGSFVPPYLDIYAQVVLDKIPVKFETDFSPMEKSFSISVFSYKENSFATVFADITEGKRKEEHLKRSEEHFRQLFETIPTGIVYQDANGFILSANSAAEEFLGLSLDQMQGRSSLDPRWKSILPDGTDLPGDKHPAMQALRTGKKIRNTVMGVFNPTQDKIIWLNVSAVPIFREGETYPCQVYTAFENVTDQIEARKTIDSKELQYRSLFDNMSEGLAYCKMIYIDGKPVDFIYLDVNESFERMTGLKGVVGKAVTQVVPGIREADPSLFELFGRVAMTGVPEKTEIFLESLNEWYEVSVYSPEKGYFVDLFDRITARKHLEEKSGEYKKRLEMAHQIGNTGCWEYDLTTKRIWGSREGFEIFGLELNDTYDMPDEKIKACISEDDQEKVHQAMADLLEREIEYNLEYSILTANTQQKRVISSMGRMLKDDNGNPTKVVGVIRDITDMRAAHDALSKVVREKEILLQEIQHRVKNNLNLIIMLLSYEMDSLTDEKAQQVLADSQSRIRAISKAYEHLYQTSDLENLDMKEYIVDFCDGIIRLFDKLPTKIQLSLDLAQISADYKKAIPIGLILNELLSNSVKYAFIGQDSGKIEIALTVGADGISCLSVSDNGVGLPEDFDPFVTESMGFMLVRLLTEQIGGEMVIERSQGTSVCIYFKP